MKSRHISARTGVLQEEISVTYSRFVWANGRAARIGITIPVCSIGRLPLLEPLPSLPNIEGKRRQSFRNKIAEAANETSFEEFFFF